MNLVAKKFACVHILPHLPIFAQPRYICSDGKKLSRCQFPSTSKYIYILHICVHNICYQEYFTISFKLFLDLLSSARSRRIQKRNVDVTIFHLSDISSWLLFKLSIFLRLNACKSTVNIASKMFFKNSHTWNSHISPSSSFSVVRICGRETFRFEFVM